MTETNPQEILTISQSIIKLMPVIIGGVVGIASSVVGGFVLHKVQSSDKKAQLKIDKMEKAAFLAYETKEWMDKYEAERLFNGPLCTTSSPINELKVLCYLYIPDAKAKLNLLEKAYNNYQSVGGTIWQEQLANNGMPPEEVAERIQAIFLPFNNSIDDFVSEVEKLINP